jgi:CheY-like chemotaxis protein
MKILIIDHDTVASQLLRGKLEGLGHHVTEDPVKNSGLKRLENEKFDVIFIDPAPLNNARPMILGIRREVNTYPYLVITSQEMSHEDAMRAGANHMVPKPFDLQGIETVLKDAERMIALVERMGDEREDFPSAGGVIAKSAFNQLFLSSIDRADRYGEKSFIIFFSMENYADIRNFDGPQAANFSAAKLSQYLVRLRRQSDIIAQTGVAEFALLLQRPQYDTEPVEAANRFADALAKLTDIAQTEKSEVHVRVRLINVPVCQTVTKHDLLIKQDGAVASA